MIGKQSFIKHINCWACIQLLFISSSNSLKAVLTTPSDNHLHGKQHSSNYFHLDMLTMSIPFIKLFKKQNKQELWSFLWLDSITGLERMFVNRKNRPARGCYIFLNTIKMAKNLPAMRNNFLSAQHQTEFDIPLFAWYEGVRENFSTQTCPATSRSRSPHWEDFSPTQLSIW